MAITGNSAGKSKTVHQDIKEDDGVETDADDNSNEIVSEKQDLTQQDFTANSDIDLDTSGLELHEEELCFAEECFQRFLLSTVGNSCSKVYDIVSKHGQKLIICSNNSVLRKSAIGNAIFILLEGKVNVLTSDKSEVLNTLSAGEIFGEVSVLFDIPVIANVVAASDVTLVKLPKQAVDEIFRDYVEDLDLIDWLILRRYLPTGSSVDSGRVYRRLALQTLKQLHVLGDWTDEMIKKLILSFDKNIVTLYPCKSIIILENDPLTSVYIILKGDIEITHGSKVINSLSITTETREPFIYTEVTLMNDGKRSPVTIKALSICQVIQLNKEWVKNILESFPEKMDEFTNLACLFRDSFKRLGDVYIQNEAYLHIETLSSYIRQSDIYESKTKQEIWRLILDSDVEEIGEGEKVMLDDYIEQYTAIVVVHGTLTQKSSKHIKCLEATDEEVIDQNGDNVSRSTDKIQDSLDGEGGDYKLSDDSDIVFSTGSILDIKTVKDNSAFLLTKSKCLILNLRKTERMGEFDKMIEAVAMSNDAEHTLCMV